MVEITVNHNRDLVRIERKNNIGAKVASIDIPLISTNMSQIKLLLSEVINQISDENSIEILGVSLYEINEDSHKLVDEW